MRTVLVSVLAVAACGAGPAVGEGPAEGDWLGAGWGFRRSVAVGEGGKPGKVATVVLPTLGRVRPDGGDVRVVAGDVVLKHQVLWLGPDDRMKVAFEVPDGARSVQVYFGNPTAKSVGKWTPRAGLLLETREYAGAGVRNVAQFRRAFKQSKKVFGRDFVGQVNFGHNPFGRSQNFVSRFTGYLVCPVDGMYEFATTSDDASFVLVDGREVCSWPGVHGAVRDARHRGRVELRAGVHRFEYCHQQIGGVCSMVAAWKVPGGKMRPIPGSAFAGVSEWVPGKLELREGGWQPDFLAHNVGEAVLTPEADRYLVEMHFENLTDVKHLAGRKMTWDFGDGVVSSEASPRHVYLVEGTYEVALTVLEGYREHKTRMRVAVRRQAHRQAASIASRGDYVGAVSGYDLSRMPARQVYWAMYYFDRVNRFDKVIAAGRGLVARKELTDESMLFAAVKLLGETERVHGKDYEAVEKLYADFERRLKEPGHRAALALARGDVQQWHLKDLKLAEGLYRSVLTDYREGAEAETVRRALFRLGEIYRWRGDGAKTHEFFERAQAIPCDKLSATQRSVRPGYLARAIEDSIRKDQMQDAYDYLVQWSWEFPTDMLEGYWSTLRIRWLHKNGEYAGGVSEAETLLKVNPKSTYAVQALMLAADCAEADKKPEQARGLLRRALVAYPESPLREAVSKRLGEVK